MQIDFNFEKPLPYSGFLEKKGSLRKNWKTRYFLLDNGILKYYTRGPAQPGGSTAEGVEIKGDVALVGADVSISEGSQLHITLHGEKKYIFYLKAKSNKEATDWHFMITKQIHYQNIIALQNNSRSPEVVEWYYQYQSELNRKHNFLLKSTEVYIHFPGTNVNNPQPVVSIFNIAMNEERTGLVLSILATGKKFNRMESINNGRIILFSDILGANLLSGGWKLSAENKFMFNLITNEDELCFETDPLGVTWLQAIQDMVLLTKIPKPSSRSVSISPPGRVMSSTLNSLIEFSSNSGTIFTSSSDVQLILEGFNRVSSKSPVITEISTRFNTILKLIPELKYNKETGFAFGERIEDIVRILGDTDNGILFLSRENDKSLLNFHLSTLNNKLNDIIQYLIAQCKPGWLISNINIRGQENMKSKFDHYDLELITIVNILIKALGLNPSMLMDKKEYSMAVDPKKSIEALGGIEAIYHDVAKERALARLIQADGHDIHTEIVEFIKQTQGGIDNSQTGRRSSLDRKFRPSIETPKQDNQASRSCWSYFCCFSTSKKSKSHGDLDYQLYDEKNIISGSGQVNPIHYNGRKSSSDRSSKSRASRSSMRDGATDQMTL